MVIAVGVYLHILKRLDAGIVQVLRAVLDCVNLGLKVILGDDDCVRNKNGGGGGM